MAGLEQLLEALDVRDDASVVTSLRSPRALRRALSIAVEMGWAATSNEALNIALRDQVEAFAQVAALDAHYLEHPQARPDLAEVAQALAELQHDSLADEPDLVKRAAREVLDVRPYASAEDVLLWAASLRRHGLGPLGQPRQSA